jgi:hypothetical protein
VVHKVVNDAPTQLQPAGHVGAHGVGVQGLAHRGGQRVLQIEAALGGRRGKAPEARAQAPLARPLLREPLLVVTSPAPGLDGTSASSAPT